MSQVESSIQDQVKRFKRAVLSSTSSLVTAQERATVREIPDTVFERIFTRVFSSDEKLARDVLFRRFDSISLAEPQAVIDKISTLSQAADIFAESVSTHRPILLISDVDNDGALAQAIMMQAKRITEADISVQPRDYNPMVHGFSIEQIENWLDKKGLSAQDDFSVFVADLGTNQKDQQDMFATRFANASLVIADHHTPELDLKVAENIEGRCLLVSPFNKGSLALGVRKGGGVSGSYLLSRVLQAGIARCVEANTIDLHGRALSFVLEPLEKMGAAANLLDGTDADIRLKPIRPTDVEMVNKLSSDVRPGRALPALLKHGIEDDIVGLHEVVGEAGVQALGDMHKKAVALNAYACALHRALHKVTDPEYTGNINDDVMVLLNNVTKFEARRHDYLQHIRPYYYHFGYDNLLVEGQKKAWSDLVKYVFRQVSKIEKDMLGFIRDYELVEEISHDHVLMTRPANPVVKNIFTPRQLNTAYHTQGKTVSLELRRVMPGSVILGVKSEVGVYDALKNVRQGMPHVAMSLSGHQNVGALTLSYDKKTQADKVIREFAARLNEETAAILANKPVVDGVEVSPLHLSLLHEIMRNMCLHIDGSAAPELIMRLDPSIAFEDKRSLKMQSVAELVEMREWETTVEPLTFSMDLSLILPNQALKGVANDGYRGGLGVKMLSNGAFMASKVYLGDQLKHIPLTKLRSPDDVARKAMMTLYEERFKGRSMPLMPMSDAEAASAIEFVQDGALAHHETKKVIAAVLSRTDADSYVGYDFEANGGVNAKAVDLGFLIFTIDGERNPVITRAELEKRLAAGDIPSVLEKVGDDAYKVEPKLRTTLFSQLINKDGDRPIRISLRVQALTNLEQKMLDELGSNTKDAQDNIMRVIGTLGKCVFQAHNSPYDAGIARANFPEMYNFIDKSIQLDTAPLAKEHRLAYFNLLTVTIDGVAFANTPGSQTSLRAMLESGEDFMLPSIKGTHVLMVSGDNVSMRNLSTGMVGPLKRKDTTRADLMVLAINMATPMPQPKYGIALLMKMASIRDLLTMKSTAERTFVPFETVPGLPEIDPELWSHFQQNYCFDRTVSENIDAFRDLDSVQAYLGNETVDIDPASIDNFSQAVQDIIAQKLSISKEGAGTLTLGYHDLLRASVNAFSNANAALVDAFSNAWVYERVLSHYEPTNKKDITEGMLQGSSAILGIPVNMIRQVYDDAFTFKNHTGKKSIYSHEAHNNVGPKGDAFQEVHAVMDAEVKRNVNPYITHDMILNDAQTPYRAVVDELHRFMALSTLQHARRHVVDLMMDTDVINSYGARQLDDYSPLGVSIAHARDGVASMRCKSISSSTSRVDIDFPAINPVEWREMDQASRDEIEQKVETAVSLLLLVNSMDKEKMSAPLYGALDRLAHNVDMMSNIAWVSDALGDAHPNDRKQMSSDWLGEVAKAMVNGKLKVKMNKHLTNKDLDVIANTFEKSFDMLDNMNYCSAISREQFLDAVTIARTQYNAFDYARKNESVPAGIKGPLKGQVTRLLNAMGSVSDEHKALNPSLVTGVLTTKKDASGFVLTSPLITEHMKNKLQSYPAPVKVYTHTPKIK